MPSRKKILLTLAGTSIAALLIAGIVHLRGDRRLASATERFESEIGALDPLAHDPETMADDENAAYWIARGSAALELSEADRQALTDFWREAPATPGTEVLELLERNAPALELLHRAADLERSSWGVAYAAGANPPLPDLTAPLTARRVLAAEARAGLAAGDRQRALEAAGALSAVRRALEREPLLVFQLVAIAVESSHHQVVRELLASDLADEALLDELARQLGSAAREGRLQAAFAVEASWMVDTVDSALEAPGPWWQKTLQAAGCPWASFETAEALDAYYHLAKASEPAVEEAGSLNPDDLSTGIVARMLIPNLIESVERHRAAVGSWQLAQLAVSLRRHALREGAYPPTLTGFPGAGEADPYAGGALRFEHLPDGSAVLSYPEAEARWLEKNTQPGIRRPPFVWQLPAPGPAR